MKVKPLFNYVLILPKDKRISEGGIVLPDSFKDIAFEAEVIAIGKGTWRGEKLIPISVKPGDNIKYKQFGVTTVKIDKIEYLLIEEGHIVAVLEGK